MNLNVLAIPRINYLMACDTENDSSKHQGQIFILVGVEPQTGKGMPARSHQGLSHIRFLIFQSNFKVIAVSIFSLILCLTLSDN